MSLPGSRQQDRLLAQGLAVDRKCTPLESRYVGIVASFGEHCWINDTEVWKLLQAEGFNHHPNSMGRARRSARDKGALFSERVFPQQVPKGALYRSTNGTTNKGVNWRGMGRRSPLGRAAKRKLREERREAERQAMKILGPPRQGPSERAQHAPVPAVLGQILEARSIPLPARPPRPVERSRDTARPQSDQRPREDRIAEAKRLLAEFDAEHAPPKRGPP